MTAPVKGPASYFPSIEKKYGHPIEHWKELIRTSPLTKHMELVTWLKSEHALGHGHANALGRVRNVDWSLLRSWCDVMN
ncbi:DUF4287 domain-containing protein [Streptomyces sp. NPDC059431]|uniref:DUF4287 domain-containing protein n=1 Tax=Streptomyces sp. NPDC059431 TaxID=3346828 RepID=UPI0036BDAE29